MYGAVVYMALAIPSLLMSMYITYTYGIFGLAVIIGVSIPQFLFGKYSKTFEVKSRTVPCATEYAEEHTRVGQAWGKNALPDF